MASKLPLREGFVTFHPNTRAVVTRLRMRKRFTQERKVELLQLQVFQLAAPEFHGVRRGFERIEKIE